MAASSSLAIAYGEHLLTPSSYKAVERVDEFIRVIAPAAQQATASIVELFPVLDYLPAWLTSWRRKGLQEQAKFSTMFAEFLNNVKDQMVRDGDISSVRPHANLSLIPQHQETTPDSLAKSLIEDSEKYGLTDEQSSWLTGIIL